MSRAKKISALIMTLVLVLCAAYASTITPTTAWFYQSQVVNGENNKFVFADFNVDGAYSMDRTINFDGVTTFKDPAETMFDDVVQVMDVEVTNDGGMPARIYATVTNETEAGGLRYFCYPADELVDGSVKATLAAALKNEMTDAALTAYNVGADGNGGHYTMVDPGETKLFKVALWIEYDESDVDTAFEESGWRAVDYMVKITMNATQDVDGALVR